MNPQVEAIRDEVDEILRKRGVVRASLFGSIARGDFTNECDVDFLVEFEKGRSLLDLAGLQLELTAALSREVDVATPNALHPALRGAILAECIRILQLLFRAGDRLRSFGTRWFNSASNREINCLLPWNSIQ